MKEQVQQPVITPVLGPKYQDDQGVRIADWDGTMRIGCTCRWEETRLYSSNDALSWRWSQSP